MTNKQAQELLIQNGQLVADTLRHLADNEIDSDYFAITSTSENGTETECELVITEYIRQAAGILDELTKALEAKDKAWSAQDDHINQQADRIESLEQKNAGLGKALGDAEKRIAEFDQRIRTQNRHACELFDEAKVQRQRVAELEASHSKLRESMATIHNTIRLDGAQTSLAVILNAAKRAHDESATAAGCATMLHKF
ncbi:hypothetical protein [Enterobacter hormaechei]|uniref:hypothetical protein n=1 Tax=Enterobacter hormaechei TaxID=158836 RepID=UPI003CC798CD